MVYCTIFGCNNHNKSEKPSYTPNKNYYRFPVDPSLRDQWIAASGRTDLFNVNNARVCSDHFKNNDHIINISTKKKRLKRGAIPTMKLMTFPNVVEDYSPTICHYYAAPLSSLCDASEMDTSLNSDIHVIDKSQITSRDCETQTDASFLNLNRANNRLKRDYEKLLNKLQMLEKEKFEFEYSVSTIFTPGQVRKLTSPKKHVHFSV